MQEKKYVNMKNAHQVQKKCYHYNTIIWNWIKNKNNDKGKDEDKEVSEKGDTSTRTRPSA